MINKRKKGVMIGVIASLAIVVILGVTFAIWTYSNTLQNQQIIAGDIFMKYTESPELLIEDALPKTEPGDDDYFEFTIDGRNKYLKPIWYEIVLNWGEAPDTTTGRTKRIKDNLLMFRLVETKDGVDTIVLDNASYNNLKDGKAIWVNTIDANTDNVKITYKLYMWISPKTNIGNTSLADYDMDTWNDNVFASIKVSVNGDFNEKIVEKEIKYGIGTETIKDRLGQLDGLIGVTSESKPVTEDNGDIREYRYSGPKVNNYIYFNCEEGTTSETANGKCELWRIIGVFKDEEGNEHLKIVRNETLSGIFPETYKIQGKTYDIRYDDNSAYRENGYELEWSTTGLQHWLNTTEDETEGEANKGYLSYLKGNSESMIEETKYYFGAVTYENGLYGVNDTPKEAFEHERTVEGCDGGIGPDTNNSQSIIEANENCRVWEGTKAIWIGKVALLYPSDYGFSTSSNYWETTMDKDSFSENVSNTSWLQTTANHRSDKSSELFYSPTTYQNYMGNNSISTWYTNYIDGTYAVKGSAVGYIRPCLYLKTQVKITKGDGTSESPYYLEI